MTYFIMYMVFKYNSLFIEKKKKLKYLQVLIDLR